LITEMRAATFTLLVLAALGLASAAGAEPSAAAAVAVDYGAPAGCADEQAFVAEVAKRAPETQFGKPGPHVRTLVARIAPRGGAFVGRLTVRQPDGSQSERSVTGETCSSVTTALAVIAALALSPSRDALNTSPPTTPAPSSSDAGAPSAPAAASTPPTPSPASREERPAVEVAAPRTESKAPEQPEPPRPSEPRAWIFSVGLHGGLVTGVSRDPLFLLPLFVDVARDSRSVVAPSARLRIERTASGTVSSDETTARAQFTLTAASLDLCPLGIITPHSRSHLCARAEGGALDATGLDIQPARSGLRPWFDAGPVVRGQVDLVGPASVELEAAMNVAFVRDRFFFEPGATVHRPAPIGWTVTAGVGIALFR
jgi:hypothetical protein